MINCTNLVKTYSGKTVLRGVTLKLEPGKIYGLIGPNGSGKTTLLSALTAQTPIDCGEVTLDGAPVWENAAALRQLCFAREIKASSQNGLGATKLKEYLRIASIYYPNWDGEKAERLCTAFHLTEPKKSLMKLSKGQLSCVSIVVALASGAAYTFLDEPVAGLDVLMRDRFYRVLLDEYAETGRTFVISTHIIEEAANLFEETLLLNDGRLLLQENTEALLARAYRVSGHAEAVDAALRGYHIVGTAMTGRAKQTVVLLEPGQTPPASPELTVETMHLQALFAAICEGGEIHV